MENEVAMTGYVGVALSLSLSLSRSLALLSLSLSLSRILAGLARALPLLLALTCSHLLSLAVSCSLLLSLALSCSPLLSLALSSSPPKQNRRGWSTSWCKFQKQSKSHSKKKNKNYG